jgi:hypothetical protein
MGTFGVFSKFRAGGDIVRHAATSKNILRTFVKNGREYQYHATKGWRSYRAAGGGVWSHPFPHQKNTETKA